MNSKEIATRLVKNKFGLDWAGCNEFIDQLTEAFEVGRGEISLKGQAISEDQMKLILRSIEESKVEVLGAISKLEAAVMPKGKRKYVGDTI